LAVLQVALMTIMLWFMAWTPYVVINFRGLFARDTVTPMSTIWGSNFSKVRKTKYKSSCSSFEVIVVQTNSSKQLQKLVCRRRYFGSLVMC
jgi:hypothetical protein